MPAATEVEFTRRPTRPKTFQTESDYDFLRVYDGLTSCHDGAAAHESSGNVSANTEWSSNKNAASVAFVSDTSNGAKGFKVRVFQSRKEGDGAN